ncbi:DUF2807 domain-containing protein [Reichenbachiella ulvae]|uniref:DUF2807 domain-containing protein n=1 Tax=Reichenbachiella ulvae TaxID=2980104 RepID=A0ABT3CSF6_9BACT|nr:DUF2807 domain-containing protein [Reichenbachiella ulvae]MCV9386542.1 DUF2807 domain-containing protein [Reichenbachiella ulvae]
MKNINALLATIFLFITSSTTLFAQEEVERSLGDFKAVSIDFGIQAELLKGSSNKVELVINGIKENKVTSEIVDGQLLLSFKGTNRLDGVSVSAKIYTKNAIESILVNNESTLSVKDAPVASTLKIVVTTDSKLDMTAKTQSAVVSVGRSAKVQLAIEANELDVNISGKARLDITGKVETLKVNAKNSGTYKGYGLQCKSLEAQASGYGRMEVSVSESLIANVVSGGKVYYKGDPTLEANGTSSGTIEKAVD